MSFELPAEKGEGGSHIQCFVLGGGPFNRPKAEQMVQYSFGINRKTGVTEPNRTQHWGFAGESLTVFVKSESHGEP